MNRDMETKKFFSIWISSFFPSFNCFNYNFLPAIYTERGPEHCGQRWSYSIIGSLWSMSGFIPLTFYQVQHEVPGVGKGKTNLHQL